MTEERALYRGLSRAAWGYLLLHFDFNLGTVSILPRFAGYLLLLSAIGKLSGERRDLGLLRPLCVLLAVWNGIEWLLSWGGAGLGENFVPLNLIVAVAGLYFHFQFLTGMAALAEEYQPEQDDLERRLLRRRTAYTVLATAGAVLSCVPAERYESGRGLVMGALALAMLAAAVLIVLGLFELRRCFREEEEEWPDI